MLHANLTPCCPSTVNKTVQNTTSTLKQTTFVNDAVSNTLARNCVQPAQAARIRCAGNFDANALN